MEIEKERKREEGIEDAIYLTCALLVFSKNNLEAETISSHLWHSAQWAWINLGWFCFCPPLSYFSFSVQVFLFFLLFNQHKYIFKCFSISVSYFLNLYPGSLWMMRDNTASITLLIIHEHSHYCLNGICVAQCSSLFEIRLLCYSSGIKTNTIAKSWFDSGLLAMWGLVWQICAERGLVYTAICCWLTRGPHTMPVGDCGNQGHTQRNDKWVESQARTRRTRTRARSAINQMNSTTTMTTITTTTRRHEVMEGGCHRGWTSHE